MNLNVFRSKEEMGAAAAAKGAEYIRKAIADHGEANIIVATGASQFEMMSSMVKADNIDWTKVTMFHLDEYVGLPESHPASFRKYLKERFEQQLPTALKAAYYVNGEGDVVQNCLKLDEIIQKHPIDVVFVGIGENGHLAFNDPPADFETEKPYLVVELDEACRNQQLGEGWFPTLEDVPKKAISMSVKQIMKSKAIINTVPDERKAQAVKGTFEGEISNMCPASILRQHPECHTFLDEGSASLLNSR